MLAAQAPVPSWLSACSDHGHSTHLPSLSDLLRPSPELIIWSAGIVLSWFVFNALRAIYGEYAKGWFRDRIEPILKSWFGKKQKTKQKSEPFTVEQKLRAQLITTLTENERLQMEVIQLRVRLSEKWVSEPPKPDPYTQFDF